MSKAKGRIHFAWWVLLGLCLMVGLGRGGLNNAGSQFLTPITEDLGIGMGSLTLYFSVASIVTMLCLPIAGKLLAKYDVRMMLIVAIVLQGGSFALFGFMNSVWGWYILSIPMAFGAIFVTQMAGPVLINQWFKKNSGLAIGIMMAASGAIGAIIQPIVGDLIDTQGWRSAYWMVGLGVIAVAVPIIFLLIRKPKDKGLQPFGADEVSDDNQQQAAQEEKGITLAAARKTTGFYALIIFFFLITSFGSFAMHIPAYVQSLAFVQELPNPTTFAGSIMSIYLLGALVGAIVFGFLSDKIGAKNTAIMAMVVGILTVVLLLFFSETQSVLMVAFFFFGFVTASIGTLGPVLTSSLFGNKEYSQIFSNASLGLAIAGIISLPIYGFIFQLSGSYAGALYAILVMLALAIVCVFIAFKSKDKSVQEGLWN